MKLDAVFAAMYVWLPWKESFVMAPLLSMLGNVVLASSLSQITSRENPELLEQGLLMISLVSNASISIVTLTFSLTVLSIQIAAQSYSPRLLDDFMKDPLSKIVISVNLGAYAFCYTMTYFIFDDSVSPNVPYIAINFLSIHIIVVLVTFVNFIHFFINSFRIEKILSRAATSSLRAAKALSLELNTELNHRDQPEVPGNAYKVAAIWSGYVISFNLQSLVAMAEKMDVCIRYRHQIGEFVNEGTILCYVWDAKTRTEGTEVRLGQRVYQLLPAEEPEAPKVATWEQGVERRLSKFVSDGILISKKRSSGLDVTLGIQQLCDIAMRALSPGVNDPHSAIQCMDVLSSLLASLALLDLGVPHAVDGNGHTRLYAPRRSFSYILSMLDSIRRCGGSDLVVCRRGIRLFGDLGAIVTRAERTERVPAVMTQLELWLVTSKEKFAEGSPERLSLEELYEYMLRGIEDSAHVRLKHETSGVKDAQDLEMTQKEADADESAEIIKDISTEDASVEGSSSGQAPKPP